MVRECLDITLVSDTHEREELIVDLYNRGYRVQVDA